MYRSSGTHNHQVKLDQPTPAPSLPITSVAPNLFWLLRCSTKTILTSHYMSPSFTKEELRTRIHLSCHPWSGNFRVKILILLLTTFPSFWNLYDVDECDRDQQDSLYKIVCAQMCFNRIVSKIKRKKVYWYLWWLIEFNNNNNPRTESRQSVQ